MLVILYCLGICVVLLSLAHQITGYKIVGFFFVEFEPRVSLLLLSIKFCYLESIIRPVVFPMKITYSNLC